MSEVPSSVTREAPEAATAMTEATEDDEISSSSSSSSSSSHTSSSFSDWDSNISCQKASTLVKTKRRQSSEGNRHGSKRGARTKRPRAARACLSCRKARTKCTGDLEPPCSRCREKGCEAECKFIESMRGKTTQAARFAKILAAAMAEHSGEWQNAFLPSLLSFNKASSTPSLALPPPKATSSHYPPDVKATAKSGTSFASLTMPALTSPQTPYQPLSPTTSMGPSPLLSLSLPAILAPVSQLCPSSCTKHKTAAAYPSQPLDPQSISPATDLAHLEYQTSNSPPMLASTPNSASLSFSKFEASTPISTFVAGTGRTQGGADGGHISGTTENEVLELGVSEIRYCVGMEDKPGEGVQAQPATEIFSILTWEDVSALFSIFFDHLHVHMPLVNLGHCQPVEVLQRSQALFNAICCVSVKYYTSKPEVLPPMRDFAQREMNKFASEKSLEYVQAQLAYLIWAPIPVTSFQKDVNWIRSGLAARMALDLDMHKAEEVYSGSLPDWRVKSMRRTWHICLMVERTIGVQLGKPSLSWSQTDFCEVPDDSIEDTRIFTASEFSQLLERSLSSAKLSCSFDDELDYPGPRGLFQQELANWRERGMARESARDANLPEEQRAIQRARYGLYFSYAQLVLGSVELQHSLEVNSSYAPFALAKFQTAALSVLNNFRDDWAPRGLSIYCNDFHFSYVFFAAVSLLKSVEPRFKYSLIDKSSIGKLISQTASLLEEASRTWDHLPFLQSKFLRRVLKARLPEYREALRGPLPARLVRPLEAALQPIEQPSFCNNLESYDPFLKDDLWISNNFYETTFGHSELFRWEEFE
ncbi:hypothetical protein T439DRAFT_94663 [Meredithblackwellia eburnea MCA 4105]